jgi:hypothetical protein
MAITNPDITKKRNYMKYHQPVWDWLDVVVAGVLVCYMYAWGMICKYITVCNLVKLVPYYQKSL